MEQISSEFMTVRHVTDQVILGLRYFGRGGFYGTTNFGGTYDVGTVFKIAP